MAMTAPRVFTAALQVPRRLIARPVVLAVLLSTLSGAIFTADTLTDREIAVSVLYVVVVLISALSERPRIVGWIGAGCGILTASSFLLSESGGVMPGAVNCMLSLIAIGATTLLAIRIEQASAARRRALADLAHMSRTMLVGELTASIAHEISQPLAAIVANSNAALRWMSQSPPRDDEAGRAVGRVARDADRAAVIVARVRDLVRRVPASEKGVSINTTIAETAALLGDQMRSHRIMLRLQLANELAPVWGDHVQLQQVLLNLMLNGIEAMLPLNQDARELTVRSAQRGRHVSVSVQDSGAGLSPEAAGRIFEAFFSTKPAGMGVGLSISRSIIEAHGGTFDVGPHPARGAVFGFTLPAHASAV